MSNEFTINGNLAYADTENADKSLGIVDLVASIASKKFSNMKYNVGTSEEAIPLGECSAPGWALFINRDATNYIELRVSSGGAKFAKLLAGEFCLLRLGSGATVPYAIADTAACQMEYLLFNT